MEAAPVLAGLLTGIVVGVTGIGGGALMTPILVFLLGVAPATAIGTDLIFATCTKLVAVGFHGSRGTIDWPIVRRLPYGSLPAAPRTRSLRCLSRNSMGPPPSESACSSSACAIHPREHNRRVNRDHSSYSSAIRGMQCT